MASVRCDFSDRDIAVRVASPKSGSSPSPENAREALWLANDHTLTQIAPANNASVISVLLEDRPVTLAVDPHNGGVWVLTARRLLKFDSSGRRIRAQELDSLLQGLGGAERLALNPFDGSTWIAAGNTIWHLANNGHLLRQASTADNVKALVSNLDESLWLLTDSELIQLSAKAEVLAQLSLAALHGWNQRPVFLGLDPLGGTLWLASMTELVRLKLDDLSTQSISLPAETQVVAITLDVVSGKLWLATKGSLLVFDRDGRLIGTVDASTLGFEDVVDLVFHPASRALFLFDETSVGHFSDNGELVGRILLIGGRSIVGVAAIHILPSLALVQPVAGALINDPKPTIRLGFGAFCNGRACLPSDAYRASLALSADLDGTSIDALLTRNGAEATYTPSTPLMEGAHTLTAQAKDLFGHPSELLIATVTVDTRAPVFLNLSPQDGTSMKDVAVTIEGSVDDPRANVALTDAAGNVRLGGATFAFPVTLTSGPNSFRLTARDPAGNESSVGLTLLHGASGITVTSHVDGAVVDNDTILVTGIFEGSPNTGITVNGIVAQVFEDRFFASVPLVPGTNALTITMTFPDGTRTTRTLTINNASSGPPAVQLRVEPASGIAPLGVKFTIVNKSNKELKQAEIDFDGDGAKDLTTTDLEKPIEHTYTLSGAYIAAATITDSQNIKHNKKLAIIVRDASQIDLLFDSIWNEMNAALIRGDVDGAAAHLNSSAQRKYKPVFTALLPHMNEIVGTYSRLQRLSISEDIAEYAINRIIEGQNRIFLIYFLRGTDGVWRLEAM